MVTATAAYANPSQILLENVLERNFLADTSKLTFCNFKEHSSIHWMQITRLPSLRESSQKGLLQTLDPLAFGIRDAKRLRKGLCHVGHRRPHPGRRNGRHHRALPPV